MSEIVTTVLGIIKGSQSRDPDSEVSLNAKFDDDLGIDSLARVDLIVAIERHFDVLFDEGELTEVVSVSDLVHIVERRLGA